MTRYAIGDIQGCMASLERLLSLISYSPAHDELWIVGDLVNRGPRSLDVLRWAMAQGAAVTSVLGNHDLHLLARAAGAADAKKRDTLDEVLAEPDLGRIVDWLRERPLVHADDRFALVHAGLHPAWTIAHARALSDELAAQLRGPAWRAFLAQTSGAPTPRWHDGLGGVDRWRAALGWLVRARTVRADLRLDPFDGPPADAPPGTTPWFQLPDRAWTTHTVVFGHWAALGLEIGARHLGIDTGCVWGKSLTAIRLDDRMVFQVKAVESAS